MVNKSWMAVLSLLGICFSLIGCSSVSPKHNTASYHSSQAKFPPQISGAIQSIKNGNPPYVMLKDVHEKSEGKPFIHKSEEEIELPKGRFISPKHWQSDGDTLDLFIGDNFTLFKESGKMIDIAAEPGFDGIVQSINDQEMTIRKVLHANPNSKNHAKINTDETATMHFVPYTYISLNGSKGKVSQIAVGDEVRFVLIGPPNEYIATQITDFSRDK